LFSLLLSLSLLLKPPQKHEKKAHHNNKQRREAPFFEDHHREGKELLKNSLLLFVQKKTQKSHVTERKSAEKQPTPLINTFALVVFITSPRHSLKLHTRATDINNNINKNKK
tara:strand:- start:34 stop:369 length:336 start_codon:yes stop_codon:yes gene_type:complete